MRDTVPGIINLPRTIRATLDDLNGPEVTFLSLSLSLGPLCVFVAWYHRATKLFTTILRGYRPARSNYYSITITRTVLSSAITISTLQAVSPAHVAHVVNFPREFLLLSKRYNISWRTMRCKSSKI